MYVVTEYGIVNLKGKSVAERAQALIAIAHPDFRESLEREAREQRIIPRGFVRLDGGRLRGDAQHAAPRPPLAGSRCRGGCGAVPGIYSVAYIIRSANPQGDGMELVAIGPMTAIFIVLTLPALLLAMPGRRIVAAAVFAVASAAANALLDTNSFRVGALTPRCGPCLAFPAA